ncbi:MAG: DUF4091 domain-containing protein [Phycisphaerales bacterium]|nr:DUF4091 domain-containing protein [Phycisphaerales bacterium]
MKRIIFSLKAVVFLVLLQVAAGRVDAGADKVVVEDFSTAGDLSAWQAGEKGMFHFEPGSIAFEFPRYQPGDEARWPSVQRTLNGINAGEYNAALVELTNPTDRPQPIQIQFGDSSGHRTTALAYVAAKTRRTVRVDFDHMASGMIDWTAADHITFYRTEPSDRFIWKLHRIELVVDDPATTEMGKLRELSRETGKLLKEVSGSTRLDREQLDEAKQTIDQWQKALEERQAIAGKAEECRLQLSRVRSTLRAAALAERIKSPMVAWVVPIGTAFRPADALGDFRQPAKSIEVFAAKGEYEETLLRITNLTRTAQDVRVEVGATESVVHQALSIRRNQSVRAADGSVVGDLLVPLDEAAAVTIAPSETIELWVRLDTKHHVLAPGSHSATLSLRELRGGNVMELPLSIHVWNFDYAAAAPLRMTLYSGISPIQQYRIIHGREDEARRNMIDYGVNVITLWPDAATRQVPYPKLTADGDLAAPLDYTEHDRAIAFFRQDGNRPLFNLCLNFDVSAEMPNWRLRNDLEPGSEPWKRGLKAWFGDWVNHLKSLGLEPKDFAFYLTDEPDLEELDRYRLAAGIIKEIDPALQVFINGSELYGDQKLNDELMKVTDIWNPNEAAGLMANPDLLPELKKYGKEIWVYECKTEVRSRAINAYDYYRLMTWRALRDHLSGVGYWHYCYTSDAREIPWDGTSAPASGVFLVYPGQNELLMSVRWELAREALEDARLYRLVERSKGSDQQKSRLLKDELLKVIAGSSDPGLSSQWRREAGNLLSGEAN